MLISRNLLVCLLVISVALALPNVHAQATSITELRHPSYMVAGSLDPVTVKATVSYQDAVQGYSLVVGILDLGMKPQKVVQGIAMASPDQCVNQPILLALCIIKTQASSGREYLEFKIGGILGEPRGPGNWDLNITAALLDSGNNVLARSESSIPFTIALTPVTLTITVPPAVIVSVDGTEQPPGPAGVAVSAGEHNITIPALANVDNETRLRFDRWADGLTQTNRSVFVKSNAVFEAIYVTQYRLTITGPQATAIGTGWYDANSLATFSVAATEPMEGVLGLLGGKLKFQGWLEDGNLLTNSTSGSIRMNQPYTLTVHWQSDYTLPASILAIVGIVILLPVAYLMIRRRTSRTGPKTEPLPSEHKPQRTRRRSRPSSVRARRHRSSRRR